MSTGQGSGGNVLAAICSLFIPGLGQVGAGAFIEGAADVCAGWRTLDFLDGLDHPHLVDHRRGPVQGQILD